MPRTRAGPTGFTLAECLMASAVLAIIVLAMAQAITSGQAQSYHALHSTRAISLVEALMEEVLSLPYTADGSTTARGGIATVAGFNNFAETAGQLRDAAEQPYPAEFQGFSRRVTMATEGVTLPGATAPTPGLSVTVTVTDARGGRWQATRFVPEP